MSISHTDREPIMDAVLYFFIGLAYAQSALGQFWRGDQRAAAQEMIIAFAYVALGFTNLPR